MTPPSRDARAERLLRDLAPQVLGAVLRRFRDFAASEDAVQEALIAAATQWPRDGVPDEPRAWLIQVASRRITDHVRSEAARRRREALVISLVPPEQQIALAPDSDETPEQDDTLALLFMCCHPALSPSSAIALTLRAVGGLTTAEIARAFLAPEATMAQRISRAKQSIKASGVPFQMPTPEERAQRLGAVLHVLYLIFNEGYTTSSGPALHRTDLSSEAIRLMRAVHALLPDDGEVAGLLALMLQAAIAAVHDEAARAEDTDWPQILALYGVLMQMSDNPMVALSRAVATAMVHGPRAGLDRLEALDDDPRLAGHYRLDAVRAHLLERAGDHEAAIAHYRRAASRTTSLPEQAYLATQAARLSDARK